MNYIECLKDAFLIEEALRYDVKGRKYIGTETKYIGLRNAILNFRQQEEPHIMENIIYNELKYRGFNVDVGFVESWGTNASGKSLRLGLEVDFVAKRLPAACAKQFCLQKRLLQRAGAFFCARKASCKVQQAIFETKKAFASVQKPFQEKNVRVRFCQSILTAPCRKIVIFPLSSETIVDGTAFGLSPSRTIKSASSENSFSISLTEDKTGEPLLFTLVE